MKIKKRAAGALFFLAFLVIFAGWTDCAEARPAPNQRRLSVALFPTENNTDFQVWQSKHYPYGILEDKMTEYLAELLYDSPKIDVTLLDENGMNRWLSQPHRADDMAVQIELYRAVLKEREIMGTIETGKISMRVKIFDAINAEQFLTFNAYGKDTRYTFNPGDDKLYWLDALVVPLPVPFKGGFDVLGLTNVKDRGQRMSRPTWQQFSGTSHWQAIKNAVDDAHDEVMSRVSIVLKHNDASLGGTGDVPFNPIVTNIGSIISPTKNSTRRRREYIISIGRMDTLKVGDVLDVVRSDTYVTVDPENPIVVLPESIGKVKVISVRESSAVVRVVKDDRKEPIQLKDLVMKFHPEEERQNYERLWRIP